MKGTPTMSDTRNDQGGLGPDKGTRRPYTEDQPLDETPDSEGHGVRMPYETAPPAKEESPMEPDEGLKRP